MESPLSFFACIGTMNHPLTRPPGTLSPSEGERDGVRARFMESLHDFRITQRDQEPATDRSADSLVRECLGLDSCGHGCPRSDSRFMESPLSFFACIGTIQGSWRENCATPHAAERLTLRAKQGSTR